MAVTALTCPSCGAPLQHGVGTCPYCGVAVQVDRPAGGPPMGGPPMGGPPRGGVPNGPNVDILFRPGSLQNPQAVAHVVSEVLGIPAPHAAQMLANRPPVIHHAPTQQAQALQQRLRSMGVEADLMPPRGPGGPPPGGPGFGGPPRGPGFGGPPRGPFGPPGGRRR